MIFCLARGSYESLLRIRSGPASHQLSATALLGSPDGSRHPLDVCEFTEEDYRHQSSNGNGHYQNGRSGTGLWECLTGCRRRFDQHLARRRVSRSRLPLPARFHRDTTRPSALLYLDALSSRSFVSRDLDELGFFSVIVEPRCYQSAVARDARGHATCTRPANPATIRHYVSRALRGHNTRNRFPRNTLSARTMITSSEFLNSR